jgi:hypothetical protein
MTDRDRRDFLRTGTGALGAAVPAAPASTGLSSTARPWRNCGGS